MPAASSDIGPDASIEAARHVPANGEALSRMLAGKTLLYGHAAMRAPYRIRLNADGSATLLKGREMAELDSGVWSVQGDQLCRDWKKIQPRHMCFAAVSDGSELKLFDRRGLMYIEARIVDDWRINCRRLPRQKTPAIARAPTPAVPPGSSDRSPRQCQS